MKLGQRKGKEYPVRSTQVGQQKLTDNERFTKVLQGFEKSPLKNNPEKFLRDYYNTKIGLHPLSSDWGKSSMQAYICRNYAKIIKLLSLHLEICV